MTSKTSLFIILILTIFLAFYVQPSAWDRIATSVNAKLHLTDKKYKIPHFFGTKEFRLGLDLQGGAHLEYQVDLTKLAGSQTPQEAMESVRGVIEERVNPNGVSEPLVQIQGTDRLVVELAGISDVSQAIAFIGQTPLLEFQEIGSGAASQSFVSTGLTGAHLENAQLEFNQSTGQPTVTLNLNDEGAKLFAEITKRNLGKPIAIVLDGQIISAPTVQSEITTGRAEISGGGITAVAGKELATLLKGGALPVPISLISQQSVGASLGKESLDRSLKAGAYALLAVAVFMILFYRIPGVAAVLALCIYTVIVLSIYKFVPVTLTLSGIAGFILSLGIAVDANVLIFARLREEIKAGRTLQQSVHEGFRRAWFSIRDSHVTTLLGALVLYIFTTSIVKGFALTLGIGVLVSLFSSIVVTRAFINVVTGPWFSDRKKLF